MILDLSHYQGSIDWEQLSPELEFVILRATCGMTKDNRYSEYADRPYLLPSWQFTGKCLGSLPF